jgi:prevent-host-death family protein
MNTNLNIGTFEAKTHFSEIMEEVQKGSDYIITKRGKPVAKIIPFVQETHQRKDIVRELFQYQKNDDSTFDIISAIKSGRK